MAAPFAAGYRLLTHREAAALLRIHVNTLRRWSNAGLIRAIKIGPRGDRRYLEADILKCVENAAGARGSHPDR